LLFGLAAGILIGSKVVTIIPVVLMLGVLVYRLRRSFDYSLKHLVRLTGIAFGSMLILAIYWYGRNLLLHDSFIYPIQAMIGSFVLIPGLIEVGQLLGADQPELLRNASVVKNIYVNSYLEANPRYDMTPGGFGPLWAWLLLPAMIPAVMLWISQKKWKIMGIFGLIWIFFLLTPGNWWWRYVIIFSMAGLLSLAEIYEWSKKFRFSQKVLGVYIIILSVWSVMISWLPAYVNSEVYVNKFVGGIATRDYSHRYAVFENLAEVQDPGTTIAYDDSWFIVYPLWNSTRTNRVVHIPYNIDWLEKLEQEGVDYIASKSDSQEYAFIQANRHRFDLLKTSGIYNLYQFR